MFTCGPRAHQIKSCGKIGIHFKRENMNIHHFVKSDLIWGSVNKNPSPEFGESCFFIVVRPHWGHSQETENDGKSDRDLHTHKKKKPHTPRVVISIKQIQNIVQKTDYFAY